jgi:hypothetical protein
VNAAELLIANVGWPPLPYWSEGHHGKKQLLRCEKSRKIDRNAYLLGHFRGGFSGLTST